MIVFKHGLRLQLILVSVQTKYISALPYITNKNGKINFMVVSDILRTYLCSCYLILLQTFIKNWIVEFYGRDRKVCNVNDYRQHSKQCVCRSNVSSHRIPFRRYRSRSAWRAATRRCRSRGSFRRSSATRRPAWSGGSPWPSSGPRCCPSTCSSTSPFLMSGKKDHCCISVWTEVLQLKWLVNYQSLCGTLMLRTNFQTI